MKSLNTRYGTDLLSTYKANKKLENGVRLLLPLCCLVCLSSYSYNFFYDICMTMSFVRLRPIANRDKTQNL